MERLRIRHLTRYSYAREVEFNRHRLLIRPREGHDLRIEEFALSITPDHQVTWVRDVFGNSVAWIDFAAAAATLEFESEVTIQRFTPFPARTLHDPVRVPYPVVYDPLETAVVASYIATPYVSDASAVQAWLQWALVVDAADTEGTVLALCRLVHERIKYLRRDEKGVQTPAQTLERGSGSCRDMATLMMEALRQLQIGARFASGYLHGTASLAGRASTHAWTEAYLPGLGWRGFDPTIGGAISLRHVVTGVSNHPRGVMPVSGTYKGSRADFRELSVRVSTEELPCAASGDSPDRPIADR